jgi:prolipoprotein diacylglyceryltransferase
LNSVLDELPRPRLLHVGREVPAFRTCGVVGFYVSLVVLFGSGLLSGRSLLVLAILALVSGLSFFVYTYLRMWITGHEQLVLLEHVWFALACNAATLALMGAPVLTYLDVVAVALCPFLAGGRVGCTLVGCCHGIPSSVGIVYGSDCVRDGFPAHLAGVRLFPVAAIEAIGLLIIGAVGLATLPFAPGGRVLGWYLISYSVMRFGLEGARGDLRPHFLGLSQARWMAILEAMLAVHLGASGGHLSLPTIEATLFGVVFVGIVVRWRLDWRRQILAPAHVEEIRRRTLDDLARPVPWNEPIVHATTSGVSLAVSRTPVRATDANAVGHVSLALDDRHRDLVTLCDLAVRAFPSLAVDGAELTGGRLLHVRIPLPFNPTAVPSSGLPTRGQALFGSIAYQLQHERLQVAQNGRRGPTDRSEYFAGGTAGMR